MWNKTKVRSAAGKYLEIGIVIIVIAILVWGNLSIWKGTFRFDQHTTTILSTTAGVVGTMFGLTAASYAFIWGDLRSDSQENQHLGKVLERYSAELWHLFVVSLFLTVVIVLTSIFGLAAVQNITNSSLYKTVYVNNLETISSYTNNKYYGMSAVTFFNLVISGVAVCYMARMNWVVFRRNTQYAKIAKSILSEIHGKYDMNLPDTFHKNISSIEYEKIHNLEVLVERILKNHESIGNAFAESQRREKLLTAIITNELKASYAIDEVTEKGGGNKKQQVQDKTVWKHLEERKRMSRWEQCKANAIRECRFLQGKNEQANKNSLPKPCECGFITVYEDLLSYRDNSLVWEEKHKEKRKTGLHKKKEQPQVWDMFERRALRYTIKKRLLIFYLRGEAFSNMDLTGVSFSGADLRSTNFSDCNLTGIRLKGANCEGADFTRSKMTGMYFKNDSESEDDETGEIQLSCIDKPWNNDSENNDTKEAWSPYKGREITCLADATFKEADVSRAYLKAPGELEKEQGFPFEEKDSNTWKLETGHIIFSLVGTNFDYAKMFFSYFKNIDFTNSSLEKAQMYNVGMVQTKAKSANFAAVTLTNSCFAWCDFENADFSDASMAETILVRVNFSGANMKNVNFAYSNMVACNFEGASCQNASFKNMVQDLETIREVNPKALRGVSLNKAEGLRFWYATLTNTDFSGAELSKVSFSNAVGQNCIFTKVIGISTVFDSAVFNSSVFNSANFVYSSLRNTILQNSVFINLEFINSAFYKTDFSGSLFAELEKPCFMGGYMYEVDFSGAKGLTASCFSNICLVKVDFKGTGIQEKDFKKSANVKIKECRF